MKKTFIILLLFAIFGNIYAKEENYTAKDHYDMAIESIRANNYDNAFTNLTEAINIDPTTSDYYYIRYVITEENLKLLLENSDKNDPESQKLISSYIRFCLNDINNAILYWNKDSRFSKSTFYMSRAKIYYEMGHYEEAMKDCNTSYRTLNKKDYDTALDVLAIRAHLYSMKGENDKCILDLHEILKYCKKAIKKEPNDISYYKTSLNANYKLGYYMSVVEDAFDMIENFPPKDFEEFDAYDEALRVDLKHAKKLTENKLKKYPDDKNWLYMQGLLTFYDKNYKLSLEQFDNILKKYGNNYRLLHAKFICYYNLQCLEKSLVALDKIEEVYDSLDYSERYYKISTYPLLNEHEKTIEESTKFLDSLGFDPTIQLLRAEAYLELGDDTKAIIDMNAVIEKDSTNAYAYYKRAKLHKKYNATGLANANYEMVLKLDTICNTSSNRHYALYHLGKKEEALEWIESIISSYPNDKGAFYDKACLLSLMGNKKEAIKNLEKAFELGYRYFIHINEDNDLDILREEPEFIALIEKYKAMHENECAELVEP